MNNDDKEQPVAQIYSAVLDLFQDKNRFAQGYYQYDKDGKKCGWKDGYCFCVLGAVCHFSNGHSNKAQCCLQRVSEHLYNGKVIQEVNDGPDGYEKVMVALKFAKDLWNGKEPTDADLGTPVSQLNTGYQPLSFLKSNV